MLHLGEELCFENQKYPVFLDDLILFAIAHEQLRLFLLAVETEFFQITLGPPVLILLLPHFLGIIFKLDVRTLLQCLSMGRCQVVDLVQTQVIVDRIVFVPDLAFVFIIAAIFFKLSLENIPHHVL